MTAVKIAINVIYYAIVFYMWYKIYLIMKHLMKINKAHSRQQNFVASEQNGDLSLDKADNNTTPAPQYDSMYIRCQGKKVLIAIATIIGVLIIKGFVI